MFTGVRYVKLERFTNSIRWRDPVLHLDNRNALNKEDQVYGVKNGRVLSQDNINFQRLIIKLNSKL